MWKRWPYAWVCWSGAEPEGRLYCGRLGAELKTGLRRNYLLGPVGRTSGLVDGADPRGEFAGELAKTRGDLAIGVGPDDRRAGVAAFPRPALPGFSLFVSDESNSSNYGSTRRSDSLLVICLPRLSDLYGILEPFRSAFGGGSRTNRVSLVALQT